VKVLKVGVPFVVWYCFMANAKNTAAGRNSRSSSKIKLSAKAGTGGVKLDAAFDSQAKGDGTLSALAYLLQMMPVIGVGVAIGLLIISRDMFTRYNAIQAFFMTLISTFLLGLFTFLRLTPLSNILFIIVSVVGLFCVYKSYLGEKPRLPLVGALASRLA